MRAELCPNCGAPFVRKKKEHGVFYYVFWGMVSLIGTGIILMVVSAFLMGAGDAVKQAKEQRRTAENMRLSIPPSASTVTPEEKQLVESIPELTWNKSDLIEKRWYKRGQNFRAKTCYFSNSRYVLQNITGEMQFVTDNERVISMSFYVETAGDFSRLRNLIEEACNSKGTTGSKGENSTQWTVIGGTRKYCINLVVRQFDVVERSLETYVTPLERDCP